MMVSEKIKENVELHNFVVYPSLIDIDILIYILMAPQKTSYIVIYVFNRVYRFQILLITRIMTIN